MVLILLLPMTLTASAATYDSSEFSAFHGTLTSVTDGNFVLTGHDGIGWDNITVDTYGIYMGVGFVSSTSNTCVIDIVSAIIMTHLTLDLMTPSQLII